MSIRQSIFAAATAVIAASAAQAADTPVKYVLDWTLQGYHAMWTAALEQDFFAKEGLAVTMDRGFGGPDTITKVASGAYDIGLADINGLVKFDADHPDQAVIGVFQVFDRAPGAVMTLKRTGITKPQDLEGKTLATSESDAARLLFPAFARANKFDASKIVWQTFAPNLRDSMVVLGRTDAGTGFTITSVFNMIAAGAARDDIVVLSYADFGVDLYSNSLVVRRDFAEQKPELVKAFIRAAVKGLNAAVSDRKAGVATVLKRDPLLNAQLELDRLDMTLDTLILTPYVKTHGYGAVVPERMANLVAVDAEAFHIEHPPKPDDLYTTRFLPPADERMPPKS